MSKVTYRQQFTRCGKERCRKCREGDGHGPYWYAYWSENGRTISKYIGTRLSAGVDLSQQAKRDTSIFTEDIVPEKAKEEPQLRLYLFGQFRIERRVGG